MPIDTAVDELLTANRAYVPTHVAPSGPRPSRRLAIVTCMDTRIDVLRVFGLDVGQTHVIRNAGARVTDDVLRSLALAAHVLGVETAAVMQHTDCGVAGTTNRELTERTGADIDFLPITDHAQALAEDVERILSVRWLEPIRSVAGLLYDVGTGRVEELLRRRRPPAQAE